MTEEGTLEAESRAAPVEKIMTKLPVAGWGCGGWILGQGGGRCVGGDGGVWGGRQGIGRSQD